MFQKTIKTPYKFKGVGIHSGEETRCCFLPAPVDTGIVFIRTDKGNHPIPATIHSIFSTNRATILGSNSIQIKTPEHLLSACFGLNIHNLYIELDKEEVPILDGSAQTFVHYLQKAGLKVQNKSAPSPITIQEPCMVKTDNKMLLALPDTVSRFTYFLEYPRSFIGSQLFSVTVTPERFINDIAPARTYGFYSEVASLLAKGLAKGGSMGNAVVIGENDYMTPLRFPNECARHKILDMIGDFSLLGQRIHAHFIGIKSGHQENLKMAALLAECQK